MRCVYQFRHPGGTRNNSTTRAAAPRGRGPASGDYPAKAATPPNAPPNAPPDGPGARSAQASVTGTRTHTITRMRLSDFDYELPPELVAQHPAPSRTASRLLHVDSRGEPALLDDLGFTDLPALLAPGDLLVFNDTRVLRARLAGRKETGGRIEVMVERIVADREAHALVRASHLPKPGSTIEFDGCHAVVLARIDSAGNPPLLHLAFSEPLGPLLDRAGSLPLPPYITHAAGAEDDARYQTVYARRPGAVAAPTAGLHFDEPLLETLQAAGIGLAMLTLHVGAGTFLPVRTEDIAGHRMHREAFEIPADTARRIAATRAAGGRIVAVGTTSLRALEASAGHAGRAETDIFITPGFRFTVVDGLVTNFHLPRSTLLMLVCAFAGMDTIRRAYAHAIAARYRFFSYGDAMLLWRAPPAGAPAAAGARIP